MVNFAEVFLSLIVGLASGAIIQHLHFRYSMKIEKIRRLTPLLEAVYPIVDNLSNDSKYANSIQVRGNEDDFRRIVQKVASSLEEYEKWFNRFQLAGTSPALESWDSDLLAKFNGIFTYATLFKMNGTLYLSQNLEEFAEYCVSCKKILRNRLS
jgi:hypothetical protein